jgi:hypothetical protein
MQYTFRPGIVLISKGESCTTSALGLENKLSYCRIRTTIFASRLATTTHSITASSTTTIVASTSTIIATTSAATRITSFTTDCELNLQQRILKPVYTLQPKLSLPMFRDCPSLEDLRRFSDITKPRYLGLNIFVLKVVVKSLLKRIKDTSWAARVVAYAS